MAFPYEVYENFEAGTKGAFDAEADLGNRLDFPHQRDLGGIMPWRGAFCMRVNIGKDNNPAYLQKTVSWASGQTRWGRFRLLVGEDVQFGNDLDYVRILQFYSTGDVREARLVLGRADPMGVVLAVEEHGETWGSSTAFFKVPIGSWQTIEFFRTVDSALGFVSAVFQDVGQITSDRRIEATNTELRLGGFDNLGDLRGTIYFDDFTIDDARLWSDDSARNGALSGGNLLLAKSGFAFLGPGEVEHISVIDGGSGDCRVRVYDTDYPTQLPAGGLRYDLPVLVANRTEQSTSRTVPFKRGAYVQLSGTNPQAIVRLGRVASDRAAG